MQRLSKALPLGITAAVLLVSIVAIPVTALAGEAEMAAEGKIIAFDRKKGNCLACHAIDDGVSPGNIGPPLVKMNARFPNKEAMRMQIWDATKRNPSTAMPPFGRHKILSEDEIDKVAAFIWKM